MGCDFSALLRYTGPKPEVVRAIDGLEDSKVYGPLQPVIDYGREQGFAFAQPGSQHGLPAWRGYPDWEKVLTDRPRLPSTGTWLELPSGFLLMFGCDAIWVSHCVRWVAFLTENTWQSVLLQGTRHFVELFGASDCIITRDDHPAIVAFREGESFLDAVSTSPAEDGEVGAIDDLCVDKGIADEIVFQDIDGQCYDIPLWDSHGYWRLPQ